MYILSSGHEIDLMQLSMRWTYRGLLAGTLEWASEVIRQKLPEEVAEQMSPGEPLVILDDGSPALPGFIWMAEFVSEDCVREDDDLGSRLFVCWFSNSISDTLHTDIQGILEAADWPKNARSFHNMP